MKVKNNQTVSLFETGAIISCMSKSCFNKFVLGGLVKVAGTTGNILAGMVTCEIVFISICGGANVDI